MYQAANILRMHDRQWVAANVDSPAYIHIHITHTNIHIHIPGRKYAAYARPSVGCS